MRTHCDPLRTTSEPPLPAAFGDGLDVQSPSFLAGCARTRSHRPTKAKTEHLNALMMHRRNGRSRRVSAPGPPRGAAGGCARTAPPARGAAHAPPPRRATRCGGAPRLEVPLAGARTAAFPPGWPPQDRLVYSVRLGHRNEARPGGSYQPCRGPVGGPSSSWHHSTPQRDHRALQTRHGRGDYTNTALPEQQLKASTWKPVVSGEPPPPATTHPLQKTDSIDRLPRLAGLSARGGLALPLAPRCGRARSEPYCACARSGRCTEPLVPGLHMSCLPCERSVGCASGLAMARARGAPVGDGRARVDAADA